MRANRTSASCASIEMLESRRLLSAAPMSVMAAMNPTPAAVHTHPTVPSLVAVYDGTYAAANGQTGGVIITISSEGKTGKLGGTLTVVGIGTIGVTGTVSAKGKFSLHGSVRHFSITTSGSVSSNDDTLSGKFNVSAKHGSTHGTFSATRP